MTSEPLVLEPSGIRVRVRRSRRARRMALRLDPRDDRAELVLPPGHSLAQGRRFVDSKRRWLERRLAALPPRVAFADGATVPIFGAPHRIRHAPNARGGVQRAGGDIVVPGAAADLAGLLLAWLRAEARLEIVPRAQAAASRLDRAPPRVTLRDPATRWGSCSGRGSLSFSWRLVMAPEPVLDYVVAHEAAHLVEMNHGPRFWRLVEGLCPVAAQPGRRRLRCRAYRCRPAAVQTASLSESQNRRATGHH